MASNFVHLYNTHLSVLVTGFALFWLPGNLNLGQGLSLLNWRNRHLLVEERTAGHTVASESHYPCGILFFLGIYAASSRNGLCCSYKCGKSNLAAANYFIPKSITCMAVYPKYKLILLHTTHLLLPPLGSQVHLMKVPIILTKWVCWLRLVKAIKYGILILSTKPLCILKETALGNYSAFYHLFTYIL